MPSSRHGLTCDHHLVLFLFDVCSAGYITFTRRLISSFLILSIVVFHVAFLKHFIGIVVNICLSLLARVKFSLCKKSWDDYCFYDIRLGGHANFCVPTYRWHLVKYLCSL